MCFKCFSTHYVSVIVFIIQYFWLILLLYFSGNDYTVLCMSPVLFVYLLSILALGVWTSFSPQAIFLENFIVGLSKGIVVT